MSPVNRSLPEQPRKINHDNHHSESEATIDSPKYDLKNAVKLPDREEPNEWIANHLFDFHKQVSMLYGTISGHCTRDKCPDMSANMNKYLWSSGEERKSLYPSAAEYINHTLDWIQEQLNDEDVFPSMSEEQNFPDDFQEICKTIARRLFRIFAHVFHNHMSHIRLNKEEAHMNTSLKHFIYFVREFGLVTEREMEPLRDHINKLELMSLAHMRISN